MKINKVLFGLFAGVLSLMSVGLHAQVDSNFVELGPVNVGGRVTSLLADRLDATTIFAGAASGGVFVRSENTETLQKVYAYRGMNRDLARSTDIWHYLPFVQDGYEMVLPVNCMTQAKDNTIIIGTGDDKYTLGTNFKRMSVSGRGVYVLNLAGNEIKYEQIAGTAPSSITDDFAAVRAVEVYEHNDRVWLFVVTKNSIYRGECVNGDWTGMTLTRINEQDVDVDQFVLVKSLGMVYFTSGNQLYKIGNITSNNAAIVNISNSNSAFGGSNSAIKIAVAPSDPSLLYAMVIDEKGMMSKLISTRDLQHWQLLTTSTVLPFEQSSLNKTHLVVNGDGRKNGTIFVFPNNPEKVVLGGSSLWTGTSYVPGSIYQWTRSSYNEAQLNYGNFMQTVFANASYVHSGINQIICAPKMVNGEYTAVYYIATDGGVFSSSNDMASFENLNRGLISLEVNNVAVAADGSVVCGAQSNACPMIESRTSHDGGAVTEEWYDNGLHGNMNHDAIVTWKDNGGYVGASMFQQSLPSALRTIFTTSRDNQVGRAQADYFDYTQTQTWTMGTRFLGTSPNYGQEVTYFSLWETDHDRLFNDSLKVIIDTLGYVLRKAEGSEEYDTVNITGRNFEIKANDKMMVMSRAQNYYPFEYVFTEDHLASDTLRVKNPLQSRGLIISTDTSRKSCWVVWMSWRVTDFSKVFESQLPNNDMWDGQQLWAGIYMIDTLQVANRNMQPRLAVMSSDGSKAYIVVEDRAEGRSMVVRVSGFDSCDFSLTGRELMSQIQCSPFTAQELSRLKTDTLKIDASENVWLPRTISSMLVDTTLGTERLILTFDTYNDEYANVAEVINSQNENWSIREMVMTGMEQKMPAYTAMVERETHDIYIGTADGVWVKSENGGWEQYKYMRGVPVTSIVQQKAELEIRRHLSHNGITPETYIFPKTKWPGAIYFGTYGRGIFMDMTYVSDTSNTILDESDYQVGLPTVVSNSTNSVSIYPNPVSGEAHIAVKNTAAGNGVVRIYDINGRCVRVVNLGFVGEGEQMYNVETEGMMRGMYLVNVIIDGYTSSAKMMVR